MSKISNKMNITLPKGGNNPNIKKKNRKRNKKAQARLVDAPHLGDVNTVAPVSKSKTIVQQGLKAQPFRIKNREYIFNVTGDNSPFQQLARFRINPASQFTFPWLSSIAKNYENYRFHKVVFHYIQRCASTTPGSLMISPDYDAADAAPVSEVVASQNRSTKEFSPWVETKVPLSIEAMNASYKTHYCMSDSRFENSVQDEKTIDCAQVFLLCMDAFGPLGKLWIEYEVDLITPQYNTENEVACAGIVKNSGLQPTTLPFMNSTLFTNNQPSQKVLTTEGVIYPTDTIGTFVREFKGFIDVNLQGTGLGNALNYTVSGFRPKTNQSWNLPASLAPIVDGGNVINRSQWSTIGSGFDFLAGDQLKLKFNSGSLPATLSGLVLNLGSSSVF